MSLNLITKYMFIESSQPFINFWCARDRHLCNLFIQSSYVISAKPRETNTGEVGLRPYDKSQELFTSQITLLYGPCLNTTDFFFIIKFCENYEGNLTYEYKVKLNYNYVGVQYI